MLLIRGLETLDIGGNIMNKEWAEQRKTMQVQIKKEITFYDAINTLLDLRRELFDQLIYLKEALNREEFNAIPYINVAGYHKKTIIYSIWHIFRIEDIVTQSLIMGDEQIFFSGGYKERIGAPIITTGNELVKQEIVEFSKKLDLEALYEYIFEVKSSTDNILKNLSYADSKRKMTDKDKLYLSSLGVVSNNEKAEWLIDYWCKKSVRGLILMPLSQHWIMHIEACLRIKNKIHPN